MSVTFGVALVVLQLVENDAGRLLGSRHGGGDDGVVLEADFAQTPSGQDQLLTAQPSQPLLPFAPLFRKVLACVCGGKEFTAFYRYILNIDT